MADTPIDETMEVIIRSGATSNNEMAVNTDGSINVVPLVVPPAPANTTPVNVSAFSDVATTSGDDTFYTITNTKILTIQTMVAGAEESTGGSIVELFYDPNANLTGMTRVSTLFVNGTSDNTPVVQSSNCS